MNQSTPQDYKGDGFDRRNEFLAQVSTSSPKNTMPRLSEFDYVFAIATLFAALDAYNIGANDVAK